MKKVIENLEEQERTLLQVIGLHERKILQNSEEIAKKEEEILGCKEILKGLKEAIKVLKKEEK